MELRDLKESRSSCVLLVFENNSAIFFLKSSNKGRKISNLSKVWKVIQMPHANVKMQALQTSASIGNWSTLS